MNSPERDGRQQEKLEITGRTVEKALEKALDILKVPVDELEIEIIDGGQKGILSVFGSRDAKIRVARKKSSRGIEDVTDEVARVIMNCLDVNYRIFSEMQEDSVYVNIETAGVDGLLIGRKGDTLTSLQHLIGRIVSRKMGGYQRLTIDVGGYLKSRHEILRQKALKAAERAVKTKKEVGLEPMKASERRIIHITLADSDSVSTYTVGNGEMRKVFVSPVRGHGGGRGRYNSGK